MPQGCPAPEPQPSAFCLPDDIAISSASPGWLHFKISLMCQSLFWKSKQVVLTSSLLVPCIFYLLKETLIYYLGTILPSWNHTPLFTFHASMPPLHCSHMTSTACPMSLFLTPAQIPSPSSLPSFSQKNSPSCLLTPRATSLEACNIVIYIFVFSFWWVINSFMSGTLSSIFPYSLLSLEELCICLIN